MHTDVNQAVSKTDFASLAVPDNWMIQERFLGALGKPITSIEETSKLICHLILC